MTVFILPNGFVICLVAGPCEKDLAEEVLTLLDIAPGSVGCTYQVLKSYWCPYPVKRYVLQCWLIFMFCIPQDVRLIGGVRQESGTRTLVAVFSNL